MNQKLIRISQPLIQELKKLSEIKAIVFYGSLGSGYADKYSDIDILCYCTRIPKPQIRVDLLRKLKVKKKNYVTNVNVFWFKNKDFTLWFKPIKEIQILLNRFSKKDSWCQNDIDTYIDKTKIIYDPKGLLKKWKNKIKYPEWMQKRIINDIQFIHSIFEFSEKAVERKNYVWIDKLLEDRIEVLIKIIYSLNKEYYSTQKWFFKDIKKFKIKPKNCLNRIKKIKNLDNRKQLIKKLTLLNNFCEDLYKLCKRKYPEFKPAYDYKQRKQIIKRIKNLVKKK